MNAAARRMDSPIRLVNTDTVRFMTMHWVAISSLPPRLPAMTGLEGGFVTEVNRNMDASASPLTPRRTAMPIAMTGYRIRCTAAVGSE